MLFSRKNSFIIAIIIVIIIITIIIVIIIIIIINLFKVDNKKITSSKFITIVIKLVNINQEHSSVKTIKNIEKKNKKQKQTKKKKTKTRGAK